MTSTLNEVILEAAMRCGAGFSSTCSGTGTTTTLVDGTALDQGTDENFGAGGWIYRPDAALSTDKVRRIRSSGFNTTTGTWSVTRAWTNAPASAEAYQVYALLPPIEQTGMPESWRRLVNRGLSATWFDDEIVVASGDGSMSNRFPISNEDTWFANEQHVKAVLFRTVDSAGYVFDYDQSKSGRGWDITHTNGDVTLVTTFPPLQNQDVIIVAARTYPTLSADTDETKCPLNLIALRTRFELYSYLDAQPASQGQYKGEMDRAYQDWWSEYRQHKPGGALVFS